MYNWNHHESTSGAAAGSRGSSRGGSQTSRSVSSSRGGSQPKEIEFQFFIRQTETQYPAWWTRVGVISWYRDLPDDTLWNCFICGGVLMALVWEISRLQRIYIDILDVIYNVSYAIHVFAIGYKMVTELENTNINFGTVLSFLVDLGSFAHYAQNNNPNFKLVCYYLRLHRPFRYLWSLNDYNLKGSILGTALKYCYIFLVLRITWGYIWMHIDVIYNLVYQIEIPQSSSMAIQPSNSYVLTELQDEDQTTGNKFLSAVYIINKMFIPIGPSVYPDNDIERIICLFIMISGCLVVGGAAVASLSLVISLYMRPEETFRARYRLIMKEMKDTQVPPSLRDKVETFYKMYWHKQKAVSTTQLMPTFPPTLPATINIDIYFEATQKARILRDLSYQMLSEIAKKMETIHYIPGDAIIKRSSKKCKIIYITYGDVEMLTAEDDATAILRMTRGTVLTPCGGCVAAALGLSHLAVRAATFCTAHVLPAADLWRIVYKHSVTQDHAGPILAAFTDHVERVKRHYIMKAPDEAIYKSSILHFNRHLIALKEMKDSAGESLLASSDLFLEIAGCYIMRNRPDTTLTDQSDEICLRSTFPCILQPSSSLLVAWHSFIALLILIVCIVHPYYLVYKKHVPLEFRFFDYFVTTMFVIDHIAYLSTGANVEEGVPISFSQTSSQQMRSHWFVLDVVATLPLFEFVGTGHFAGINKLLRLPKLFRVLKSMEETCVYRSNVLRFLSYSLLLLIACYLIAAMQQGFMCYTSGRCLVRNFTHPPFWEQKELDEETVAARLTYGLYWAISMINFVIHRETWGKENWKDVLYTLVILEICIVLRIFMEAVYSATIMVTTALREDYGARIATVKSFLIRNEVDPTLRKRFIDYLELCWYTDKAYKISHKKHSTIFYDLPPHVYQDIVGRNRIKYILCIPFMKIFKKEDLKTISSKSQLFYTSPNEILMNTGELTNEMYIIKQGICEILSPNTKKAVGQLTSKSHFGAIICLLRLPAYYTIRAVTHVQVLSIPRKHMLHALETPQIRDTIAYLKTTEEFHRMTHVIPSFVKYEPPPPTPNMMHFKLPRKHEPDAAFLHPFKRLGFLSILRYVFPRFTIRPDGTYMLRYEWFRATCALLASQLFPHYTYLVLQWPFLYFIATFLDLAAVYDIFQRMLVGYFNEKGILVYHPSSTAAYYMKGPFIMDLLGCLPLEDLEGSLVDSVGDKLRVTPTKQFLMLNRLIQLYRLPSAMMMLKDYIGRRDILMVIKAIPLFMAMMNVLTCFMIFYSVKIYYSKNADGSFEWVLEPFSDAGGSWIHLFAHVVRFNLTETPWNLHLATYFWVVYECSTTGYGVFNPSNHDLMQVLFFGMASSTMVITYFTVRILSIRANVNKSLAGFQQHMKDINVYMAREKLDSDLQKEIRRYYEYNWEKMGGIDYRGVLKLCDQITLRTDAILHIYGATFTKCPLLSKADVSLLRIVGRAVHSIYFLRDMKILELDDMCAAMYFVDYGGVELRVPTGEMSSVLRLPRGSVFGNLEGTYGHRCPYNVVATSRLHLLRIKSVVMASIMKDFPALKELMDRYRTKEKKMYILGSEVHVKMRRNVSTAPPVRSKKSILKYIYFQDGFVQLYLLSVSMACIYLDLYNAGYQDNRLWLLITLYGLDFAFLWKILTQHSLPLVVGSRNMKKFMMPIRKLYFKREFRYDMLSIVPIELVCFSVQRNRWMWFSWLRLNRMFRITTVYKCLRRRSEKITVNLTLSTVLAVTIWFTLFVHTTTCIWYFIGMMEDLKMPNSSWRYNHDGFSVCHNQYICSTYFVITTFTQNGVGDIIPKKQSEVVFVTLLMILSTMVVMIYVGEFSNIIQFQSYRSFSFYRRFLELQDYMNNNRVSQNLMTIVNKYTLHLWRETRGLQVPHFLKCAPLSLRLRVMSAAYLHHITRHHIFEECEPAFLRQLCGCIQLYTYNEGMFVVKESEITECMYVIHTGKVKETCEDMDISARVYPAGSYFGILQGLIHNTPYTHSYETMCQAQVLSLHLNDWEHLLKHFPDSRDAIHKHMSQVGDKDMDKSNWPGGAPGPPRTTEFEPLSQIEPEEGNPDILSKFPGTSRHFGRHSSLMDSDTPPPTRGMRRQSQFIDLDNARGEDREAAVDETQKEGFFGKLLTTVKKIMGRVSDSEALTSATEGKDDLLLEEDEEATEALLAQFEAAKKQDKKRAKSKVRTQRKNIFQSADEEDTEKHMLTLDISDSNTDQLRQSESQMLKTLKINDQDTSAKNDKANLKPTKSAIKHSTTAAAAATEKIIKPQVEKDVLEKKDDIDPKPSSMRIQDLKDELSSESVSLAERTFSATAEEATAFSKSQVLLSPDAITKAPKPVKKDQILYRPEDEIAEATGSTAEDTVKAKTVQNIQGTQLPTDTQLLTDAPVSTAQKTSYIPSDDESNEELDFSLKKHRKTVTDIRRYSEVSATESSAGFEAPSQDISRKESEDKPKSNISFSRTPIIYDLSSTEDTENTPSTLGSKGMVTDVFSSSATGIDVQTSAIIDVKPIAGEEVKSDTRDQAMKSIGKSETAGLSEKISASKTEENGASKKGMEEVSKFDTFAKDTEEAGKQEKLTDEIGTSKTTTKEIDMSEKDTKKIDAKKKDTKETVKGSKETEPKEHLPEINTKEEGTSVSASKLNRRFVHVRYEEKEDEEEMSEIDDEKYRELMLLDSDGLSIEGDTASSSTPDTPESRKKNKKAKHVETSESD